MWDSVIAAGWRAVDEPTLAIELRPGLSLPLGPSGASAPFVPGTSGSVDPWLAASLVAGGDWLAMAEIRSRVPLVAGRDDVVQGAWVRADLGAGRRLGPVVVTASASGVQRANDDTGLGGFTELAAEAGVAWAFDERWATSLSARVPVWMDQDTYYTAAAGVSVTRVWGGGGNEAGDDHHDD